MPTKIRQTYNLSVYSYILNNKRSEISFPETSNFVPYSTFDRSGNKPYYWALIKNKSEIPNSHYRNGILDSHSLMSYIKDNSLYVKEGQCSINGEVVYVTKHNTVEDATLGSDDLELSGNLLYANSEANPFILMLNSYIYSREYKSSRLLTSPKEYPDQDGINFLSYWFDENLDIQSHNFLTSSGMLPESSYLRNNMVASLESWGTDTHLASEFLGRSKGLKNEVFRTRYFPISEQHGLLDEGDGFFAPGYTTLFSRNRKTGVVTKYIGTDSYLKAEMLNLESPTNRYVYLDRFNGKVFFGRQTLAATFGLNLNLLAGDTTLTVNGDLFDDNGYVEITPVSAMSNMFWHNASSYCLFWKIGPDKIVIRSAYNYQNGWLMKPYTNVPVLGVNDEVYCYYGTCTGFQTNVADGAQTDINAELPIWAWKDQKTIAVLQVDKDVPYKISIKAVDIPYIRRGETTNSFVYGPLGASQELVLLEGEVVSETNQPIGQQLVTVSLISGNGLLNGRPTCEVTTDDEGHFYALFDPNLNRVSWLIFKSVDFSQSGTNTYLEVDRKEYTEPVSSDTNQKNIIYAITKDDGTVGTVGRRYIINPLPAPMNINNKQGVIINPTHYSPRATKFGYTQGVIFYDFLNESEITDYIGGKIYFTFKKYGVPFIEETQGYEIKDIMRFPEAWKDSVGTIDFGGQNNRRLTTYCIVTKEQLPTLPTSPSYYEFANFRVLKKADVEFSPTLLNGRKSVILENKPNAVWKHPEHPELTDVKGPVMTASYSPATGKFTVNKLLPAPNATDSMSPVAAYAMIPERKAQIIASTASEYDTIQSNIIEFEIEINERDKGVIENLLGTIKIPYGWRLRDSYSEDASTIGVNTFFTVNRVPGSSQVNPKIPLISYVSSNGINYLGYSSSKPAYTNASSSIKMRIALTSDDYTIGDIG